MNTQEILKTEKMEENRREEDLQNMLHNDIIFCLEQNGLDSIISSIEYITLVANNFGYSISRQDVLNIIKNYL